MSAETLPYDVFLSHSAKDKAVGRVLPVAASRQSAANSTADQAGDGKVDDGALPSRRYAEKIEDGPEHSRVLVLCMSAHTFGSDWAQLPADSQPSTFNHQPGRAPLNQERRFIPLRLDDAPIKGSLAQFLYINWRPQDREREDELPSAGWKPVRSGLNCNFRLKSRK